MSEEADWGSGAGRRRGTLRVFLGAAPGVGKTYAMLNEGRRAKGRGVDVVIGYVETHGRRRTAEQISDIEVVPRRHLTYRGAVLEEMDVDAILARHPERALVDELAHTNVPGSRNEKRWQDVEELLAAGIDVVSTVNIQHLESINDVVERITGIRQHETIPDEIVRRADEVSLVDQTPQAIRRRLAHGNIYAAEKIDAALANYFREGNLGALRELALLWVADKVDVGLEEYRERHGITETWETRERIVVALTGAPGTEALIRRAARIAQRAHGDLIGVHVHTEEGLSGPSGGVLDGQRRLLADMGGEMREVGGVDIADSLVAFSRAENATQLVLGAGRPHGWWTRLTRGSVINRVVGLSGGIEVHVIPAEGGSGVPEVATHVRRVRAGSALGPRRSLFGWILALGGVPALVAVLVRMSEHAGLPTVLLSFVALVVVTAAVGGRWPAVVAAVAGFLAANWFFTPPFHTWTIAEVENLVALVIFLGVAVVVSRFVDAAARRSVEAAKARSEARSLAALAATTAAQDPFPELLDHVRSVFGFESAALLRRVDTGWECEASAGEPIPKSPADADFVEDLASDVVLAVTGGRVLAEDQAVLKAFAAQLAAVVERNRLRAEAGRARALSEANALRSALLQAVSHDLRTPLASIKASASSLRQHDVEWTDEQVDQFLCTIDVETDRLTALVANLLDMSRIQVGALRPLLEPVSLEEVLPAAVADLGPRAAVVDADVGEELPAVMADPTLLERALANVIGNAVRFTPPGRRVRVEAGAFSGRMDIRVVDQGPGIPPGQRDQVFQPFQRLGDNQPATGVGLGLAVAQGFLASMGGTIDIEDTPGGGTTMLISLPIA